MYFILSVIILYFTCTVNCSDVSVEIDPSLLANIISKEFVSFNIESNHIFDAKGFLNREKLNCIKNTLSPAYLRINAPTTDDYLLENSMYKRRNIGLKKNFTKKITDNGEFTFEQMGLFLDWIQSTNFTPYIVMKNNIRNADGDWNTKLAIRSLSLADTLEIGNSVWQLENDCHSLDISKYVSDLKTLESILETFDLLRSDKWMITAGDISACLGDNPKDSLKDLLSLDDSILEAMIINNNTHLEALDELNEESPDITNVILYKTVNNEANFTDDTKAINWINTLGIAAVNGYAAVFRDLNEDLSTPSLTYYSSLLYKKLVGRRVLHISQTNPGKDVSVFAHCATLSGGPVSGGVTIFATNLAAEKKSISIDLVVPDENSEIMQYVLYLSEQGKIIVNENEMVDEDDLQPIIQKVKPFKKLTVILPPRSFGFWVVSSTNVNLCALEEDFVENIFNKLNDENQVDDDVTENAENPSVEAVRGKRDSTGLPESENYKMQWKNGIHFSPNQIDIILSKASENNKIHDLKELFAILGQLASLIELQEEFLDLSSDIFKSPMMQGFMDQEKLTAFSNDIKKISNILPSTPNPEVIRVFRSANVNLEPIAKEGEKRVDSQRLVRDAECESCIDLTDMLRRQKINTILNKIKTRTPFALNTDNIFRNAQPEKSGVDPLEAAVRNVENNNEMLPSESDQTSVLDTSDLVRNAAQVTEEEISIDEPKLTDSESPTADQEPRAADQEPHTADQESPCTNTEKVENESKANFKPVCNLPTLSNPQISEKSSTNLQPLDKSSSLNNLVRKAQELLVQVNPRLHDDEVLESKILEDRIGLPPVMPRISSGHLSLELQKNRLRLQELRNKIQLKLADLRAKQFLDRQLHRLGKRSIDSVHKVKKNGFMKKFGNSYKNIHKKSPKFVEKIKVDSKYSLTNGLDVFNDENKILRAKRLVSNSIEDEENSIDFVHTPYEDKQRDELDFHKYENSAKFTPTVLSNVNSRLDKINSETSTIKSTISNEIFKENPESSDECFTVTVTDLGKSKSTESKTDDESLEVIGENVNLTINWLNDVIHNLKSFATSVKQKLAETFILKNLLI